jgi:hypothetical protein
LWFRLGITPDTPFGSIHQNPLLAGLIPDVFANSLIGGQDPQVPVYRASPADNDGDLVPDIDQARFRVLMPGGHARGSTWTLHGHQWQRQPYVCGPAGTACTLINGSSQIGDNPLSEYFGAQEGINPTGHWDFVVNLGGHFDVTGDYLLRDQASFGSYQGLWGLLRFDETAPVAGDGQYTVPKYSDPIVIDLLDLAFDLDGLAGATVEVTDPTYGSLSPVNGAVSYTPGHPITNPWGNCPDADASICEVTFGYTVTDVTGRVSNDGTVTILVTNTAPVAVNDLIEIVNPATSDSVDVLLNDVDAEGDVPDRVTVATGAVTAAAGTTVGLAVGSAFSISGSEVTYTVPDGIEAPVGIVMLGYTLTDESGAVSNEGSVRVAVNADEIAITRARFQEANGTWSVSGTCTVPGAAITVIDGPSIDVSLDPSSGNVLGHATCETGDPIGTFTWSGEAINGTIPVVGEDNFVSALSANFGFDEAFPVDLGGVNDLPVAMDDSFGPIDEDTTLSTGNVLTNDTDADGDTLSAVLETGVANGTLVLNADGSFTYTPNAGFNGSDSFTYRADDGKARSEPATATIEVTPVPDAPAALDDLFSFASPVDVSTPYVGDVLANDTDDDGDLLTVDSVAVGGISVELDPAGSFVIDFAADRTATLNSDGSFEYAVPVGFTGSDSFTYVATDGTLASEPATVTLEVGLNRAPVAVDDAYDAVQNTELTVTAPGVLGNDTDPDNTPPANPYDDLNSVLVTGPVNGTVILNGDGSFLYTPTFNFTGVDSFTYVANDGTAGSNVATVMITVKDVVDVTSATFRDRQSRWNIQGTLSVPTNAVDLYLNSVLPENLIGSASVDGISGDWSFTQRGSAVIPGSGDAVVAVSSGGGVSDPPFPVTVRN